MKFLWTFFFSRYDESGEKCNFLVDGLLLELKSTLVYILLEMKKKDFVLYCSFTLAQEVKVLWNFFGISLKFFSKFQGVSFADEFIFYIVNCLVLAEQYQNFYF